MERTLQQATEELGMSPRNMHRLRVKLGVVSETRQTVSASIFTRMEKARSSREKDKEQESAARQAIIKERLARYGIDIF